MLGPPPSPKASPPAPLPSLEGILPLALGPSWTVAGLWGSFWAFHFFWSLSPLPAQSQTSSLRHQPSRLCGPPFSQVPRGRPSEESQLRGDTPKLNSQSFREQLLLPLCPCLGCPRCQALPRHTDWLRTKAFHASGLSSRAEMVGAPWS